MRVAYLDCFAGIAGDMFLGALIDAGVPATVLHEATAALNINASLCIETVDRSGISCTKVHVLEAGELAEKSHSHAHEHTHETPSGHTQAEPLEQQPRVIAPLSQQLKTQHLHKTGHPHTHEHTHSQGRSLTQIRSLIQSAPLHHSVKPIAIRAFDLLGQSEAKIHNVPVEQIHFHEVGAVDAIVDIVAASAGIHHLHIGAWYSSPLNVGGGMVQCAHGTFPVPAPATADLLRGVPTYSAHIQKELVTPTGAALIRALNPTFGQQPAMRVEQIGYGAGTRNPRNFPNVLRLSIGSVDEGTATESTRSDAANLSRAKHQTETVTVLETALDDASPQLLAYVAEQALAQGALDVMLTPVVMKKGRPGTLLTVLSRPADSTSLQELLLRETPTLGLRIRQDQRTCLEREHIAVDTAFGTIRIKLGRDREEQRNAAPEFEDCKAAALKYNAPLKQVQQAAIAAFLNRSGRS